MEVSPNRRPPLAPDNTSKKQHALESFVQRPQEEVVMKVLPIGLFVGLLLCGLAVAQETTPPSPNNTASPTQPAAPAQSASPNAAPNSAAPNNGAPKIAPGSVIPVQLTKNIDAKKVKNGDEVEAKVAEDLKAGNGEIVVPKNTKILGKITEAQARNKEQKESEVGIAFDRAVMANGAAVTMPMSIQAIIAPSFFNGGSSNSGSSAGEPPAAQSSAGGAPGNARSGMGGATSPQTPVPATGGDVSQSSQNKPPAHEPITGDTKGVLGMEHVKLSAAADTNRGSVVSSEKGNVKLESGTLLLLRVNP
jgi:hypothetical protein